MPLATCLGTTLLGFLTGGTAWTDEKPSDVGAPDSPKQNLPQSLMATSSARQPLKLLLTRSELVAFVRAYEIRTGEVLTAPIDDEEVMVTAPGYRAPMRDVSQDVWGGIAAPIWAIMNPKNAWRIFVPIPPKDQPEEAEPPAPYPR